MSFTGSAIVRTVLCALALVGARVETLAQDRDATYPSAMNEQPASPAKQELIRKFMAATGLQGEIDSGSFLERYALNAQFEWNSGEASTTLFEAITGPIEALRKEYENYRSIYQAEYESHINWEYTEEELRQMVAFFESPVGQHYLDGNWRMRAYSQTNLEEIEVEMVRNAVERYQRERATKP